MNRRLYQKLGKNLLIKEGLPLLGLYWLYSTIRWLIARSSPYEAFQNAFRIVDLERQLGIFHELAIQRWFIDHAMGVVHVANEFYTIGYFPVLIICSVLLYRFGPERFPVFKSSFMLGLGFALVLFSIFPLAPPRMLTGLGFVDTQRVFGSNLYNNKSFLSFYNPYAAMPSLHFGWALLVGIMAFGFKHRLFKILGVLYPACMAFVIVTTGHHFFLDIVGGAIVVSSAYALVTTLPAIVSAPPFRPVSVTSDVMVRERKPRWSRSSTHETIMPWSKAERDQAQQHRLQSTIAALLTHWTPPV